MSAPIGFFEEAAGARSMTRLGAFLWIAAGVIVGVAAAFAITAGGIAAIKGRPIPDGLQSLVSTSALVIGALGASAWSALKERTKGDDV